MHVGSWDFVSIKHNAYPFMDAFQGMHVGSWNSVSIKDNAYPFMDTFQACMSVSGILLP